MVMTAEEAICKLLALRRITAETGCITRRSQSFLLGSLDDTTLTEVAYRLSLLEKETENADTN
jgi:hypothetical protein